jgi:hypothetical protein
MNETERQPVITEATARAGVTALIGLLEVGSYAIESDNLELVKAISLFVSATADTARLALEAEALFGQTK